MSGETNSDFYGSFDGWQESQPARTDTQLPSEPPLVQADPTAVGMVIVVAVILLGAVTGCLIAWPGKS